MMTTLNDCLDRKGKRLDRGDRVKGTLNDEAGIVLLAEGSLIRIRIDSTGQLWSSAARLWSKDE